MRWVIIVVAVIIGVPLLAAGVGLLLPEGHRAATRATYAQPPEALWDAITDVRAYPEWRSGLDSVKVLEAEPLRWREYSSFGPITFRTEMVGAPHMFQAVIDDEDLAFGGRWTWRIDPAPAGAVVTITEAGEVYNPLFRFMSRFIFGYHGTQRTYLEDLGRRFGQDEVVLERVE